MTTTTRTLAIPRDIWNRRSCAIVMASNTITRRPVRVNSSGRFVRLYVTVTIAEVAARLDDLFDGLMAERHI